jgi:dihydrofolate synthase/folylpolyglutamate synthase
MDVAAAQALVDSLARFGMRFGLERTLRSLEALGHPERRFPSLHVAGTNGKGSTCAFAAAILRASGRKVGLYTSPHLLRFDERIRVDGTPIPDSSFAQGVAAILQAFPQALVEGDPLTFFELTTVLALWHFARERVELAVLETGLGGRLDATNAVDSRVALVTRIGLDHTALLGDGLAAIASEKAGIFKPGARTIIARQAPEALAVLRAAARAAGGAPLVAGVDFWLEPGAPGRFDYRAGDLLLRDLELGLLGAHQRENAESAIAAARLMEPQLPPEAIRRGLAGVEWPGRLERASLEPLTILDGAHNPDGARSLARSVRELWPLRRVHLVLGALADKDVRGIAAELLPLAERVYLCSPACDRALSVDALARLLASLEREGDRFDSVGAALDAARADARSRPDEAMVLVAGSLYVVGEAKRRLVSGAR